VRDFNRTSAFLTATTVDMEAVSPSPGGLTTTVKTVSIVSFGDVHWPGSVGVYGADWPSLVEQ
jgi:hypothetical protein